MWEKKEVFHLPRYKRYKRCFANKKHSRKLLFAGYYHCCHVNMGLSGGCEGEKAERKCSESPSVSGGAVVIRQDWADCLKTVTPSSCCRLLNEPRHISLSHVLGSAWSWRGLLQWGFHHTPQFSSTDSLTGIRFFFFFFLQMQMLTAFLFLSLCST